MKIQLLIILLVCALTGSAQTSVYTFNNGILYSEKELKSLINTMEQTTPTTYQVTPIVYHKAIGKDTVVNFITFSRVNLDGKSRTPVEILYRQDSAFLLLNKRLPEFLLKDLEGKTVSSTSLLGKPTLINFWNTHCRPCIAEMPQLSKLKDKYGEQMNFLSITDDKVNEMDLIGFLKNKGFNYQVLESGGKYSESLHITSLPKNIFLDKDGVVRYIQLNYPIDLQGNEITADSPDNYFTTIVHRLIGVNK